MTPLNFDMAMLWPITVIVALSFISAIRLLSLRIPALRNRTMKLSFYETYRDGAEPDHIAAATRHYTNLFETPMLFYLGCLVAGILGPASSLTLFCAWAFVVLRVTQSIIHLTSNIVKLRAYAFFSSMAFLLALWASNVWALASY